MNKNWLQKQGLLFLLSLFLFLLHIGLFIYVWIHDYSRAYPSIHTAYRLPLCVYGILLGVFSVLYGAYRIDLLQVSEVIYSQIITLIVVNLLSYFQISLTRGRLVTPWIFLALTGIQILCSVIWALFFNKLYHRLFPPERLVVISDPAKTDDLLHKLRRLTNQFMIVDFLDCSLESSELLSDISQYDAVLICEAAPSLRSCLLNYCYRRHITIYVAPTLSDLLTPSRKPFFYAGIPLITSHNAGLTFVQRCYKRALDLALCIPCLLLTVPLMGVAAIAIKCYDRGPVLFRQKRYTIDGRQFSIFKLRSMVTDAEKDGIFQPKSAKDPRITPVGRLLRKTHLDELPQLFNILRGEMSFVGPRPLCVEHVEQYTRDLPEFAFRLKVKSGLTGYAQLIGDSHTPPLDKLKLDLMYIQNYSFLLDLKLLLITFKEILLGKGGSYDERKDDFPSSSSKKFPK